MEEYRFKSVFAIATFQFCGHIDEYLIANTEHLCLMYCQPRFGEHNHVLRRYEFGSLVEERKISSSQRLFSYYWLWFWHYNAELYKFARPRRARPTLVICGHPINLFFSGIIGRWCNLRYSYQIGDYFPSRDLVIRMFERVKKFYHDRVDFAFYLSNAINRKFNGGMLRVDSHHQTVMWGVKSFGEYRPKGSKRMLFVGLMRSGQGIGEVLQFMATHAEYALALVGVAANGYDKVISAEIARLGLASRVYFQNRFHSERELREIAKTCFCGLALYDRSEDNFTHYADPGKVKAYMELGLPAIMTRISDIVPYVEKFKSGEIVDDGSSVGVAIEKVSEDESYSKGVEAFNTYFGYRAYYDDKYAAWKEIWA